MTFIRNSRRRTAQAWPGLWGLLLVLISLPGLAAVTVSKNPHLKAAYKLFDAFEYDEALRKLDKAEQWSSNTAQDKVEIALLEGVLAYETQQPVRGDRAFERALEMDPQAKPTIAVSPKVAAKLDELRAKLSAPKPTTPAPQASAPTASSPAPAPVVTAPPNPTPAPAPAPALASAPASPSRMNLKLPVAIGGGVVAVGGMLAWGKAKSIEGKVRNADASLTTRAQLDDAVQQGKTFEKVGWILMGLGAATTAGSLLFLDAPAEGKATITPIAQGAQLSVSWSLP